MRLRKNRPIKVRDEVHSIIKQLKRDMEAIEGNDIDMGDVIERAIKSDEIKTRLLMGSKERRMGLK